MANVLENPEWVPGVYQIETTDLVEGGPDGVSNVQAKQLASRTAYLKQQSEAQTETVGVIAQQMEAVELASAVHLKRSVDLDWLYRGRRLAIELFAPGYSLAALPASVSVISGIAGDDSLDVASSAALSTGVDYLLHDTDGTERVRVRDILAGTRVRLTANLTRAFGADAIITASTFTQRDLGGVDAADGSAWLSGLVNLGTDNQSRAIVIRRTLNAGVTRLFWRDSKSEWTEALWSVRRAGGGTTGVPDGYADYEYLVPMRGDGFLRAEVVGEPVQIAHIVALAGATGLGGYVNPQMRPTAPVMSHPANLAVDVGERPTLQVTGFNSPAGNKIATARFQISTSPSFESVLHDSGKVSGVSYSMPASVLGVGTKFYVRPQLEDDAGLVSDWGEVTSFTTKSTYAYVMPPTLVSPAANQVDVPEQPTLQSSAFAVVGAEDVHVASRWRVKKKADSWDNPAHDTGRDATSLVGFTLPARILKEGETEYVAQVMQEGETLGWSEWSEEISFVTKSLFAQIIGIVQVSTGGGAGTWQRINENFEAITTNSATFNNHPVYAGVIEQVVDGQAMVKVPKYYIKRGTVPSGVYVGKPYRLISDQPAAGFTVNTAFKKAGVDVDQFWVGKYQATSDGSKVGSKAGLTPLVSIDFPTMQARAAARNVSGVDGFMMWSGYQLSAIQTLALIEMGGSDSQSLIGQGNVSGSSVLAVDHATVAQASWRGIVGLWGNVWQMVDGIRTDASSKYEVWDNQGNKTYKATTKTIPASGWSVTMESSSGADFDLGDLFLASTTDATEGNGTYGDYSYSNGANKVAYHGGHYGYGSKAGLFVLNVTNTASNSITSIGSRLAKV